MINVLTATPDQGVKVANKAAKAFQMKRRPHRAAAEPGALSCARGSAANHVLP